MKRLPIVGVMGSGRASHWEKAAAVGKWLAAIGVNLLTGGGAGVMAAVSRVFFETPDRRGKIIGIVPGQVTAKGYLPLAGYPNKWVEIPIYTHLPLSGLDGHQPMSRNHINILSSDVVIALPGSSGTASEVRLALQYQKPVVCYLDTRQDIPGLPDMALVERDFAKVQAFVSRQVSADLRDAVWIA